MALQIGVESNIDLLVSTIDGTVRQLPFAMSVAINETAKSFQKVQRRHQERVFTVRRKTFVTRSVKIKPFATKRSLEARVSIDPPGGQKRADILAKFEEKGVKRPRDGSRLAVPVDVKRTKAGVVSKSKRPRSFDFKRVGRALKGKNRTFMIRGPGGTGGIFQRVGRKGTKRRKGAGRRLASSVATRQVRDLNIRTLFRFTPQAKIDDRLNFVDNGKKTVRAEFPKNFHEGFERALATARRSNPKAKTISRQARRILRADVSGAGRGGR